MICHSAVIDFNVFQSQIYEYDICVASFKFISGTVMVMIIW